MDWEEDIESSSPYDSDEYSTSQDDSDGNKASYKFKRSKQSCLLLQKNYLQPIAQVLQEVVKGTPHFFSEDELCKTDFNIKVEGVGHLTFPLTANRLEKLVSVSNKVPLGNGEETLPNKNIVDTPRVIPGQKLTVHINQARLTQMLGTIRSEIGISDSYTLEARLDNMLICSPGQFLDFHQDSEKTTDMLGTLVVIVPSPHIGGNMIIQYDTKEHVFVSENLASKSFKCVGFYVDCNHKIEKVRQGVRVALLYKLILKSGNSTPTLIINQNLKYAIKNYFDTLQQNMFQDKFVYLLDHSYTEQSLNWNMLKGEDNKTGTSLLAVAKSLDLVPYLAFVEIQYIWGNLHKYRHHCANPIPIDLDYVHYHMLCFINSKNEKQPYKDHCGATEKEICWNKETTSSFKPFRSFCEGFTGEGLSVDYWYKRAVVVLWPSSMKTQMHFKLNYEEAFKELQAKVKNPGNEREVSEIVKKCVKYLCRKSKCERKDFNALAEIALYIKDNEVSKHILSHFNWDILNYIEDNGMGGDQSTRSASRLAKLDLQYGSMWCYELLKMWNKTSIFDTYAFIDSFLTLGGSKDLAQMMLKEQICNISSQTILQNPDDMEEYIEIVCGVFVSCSTIKSDEYFNNILRCVISNPLIFTNRNLKKLYLTRMAKQILHVDNDLAVYCKPLKTYIETKFGNEIANEESSKNDWTITKQLNCQCKPCKEVNVFLLSKTKRKLELKLPKPHREHVKHLCKSLDLPVRIAVNSEVGIEKLYILKSESLILDRIKECAKLKRYLQQIQ